MKVEARVFGLRWIYFYNSTAPHNKVAISKEKNDYPVFIKSPIFNHKNEMHFGVILIHSSIYNILILFCLEPDTNQCCQDMVFKLKLI